MENKNINTIASSFWSLFKRTLISLVVIIGIIVLINLVFHDYLSQICKSAYDKFGVSIVSVGYFSTSFLFPFIPDDIFSATALLGEVKPLYVFAYAWLGSVLGSILAYYLGSKFKYDPLFLKLTSKASKEVNQQLDKHGYKAIGIAALTPLPDAPFSWMYGAYNLPFMKYLLTYAIGRGIKLAYMTYILNISLS